MQLKMVFNDILRRLYVLLRFKFKTDEQCTTAFASRSQRLQSLGLW